MTKERSQKFQWISLVYLFLFAAAVFSPSFVRDEFFGIREQHLEEVLIFVFGISGIGIFMLYERLMERKEKEHEEALDAWEKARRELVSSYQYIGSLNRQMEIIKKLSNDTSRSIFEQDNLSKDLLQSLAATVSSSMGGAPTVVRILHLDKLRTEKEFIHGLNGDGTANSHLPNKELKRLHDKGLSHGFLEQEEISWVAVPSDRTTGAMKVFILVKSAVNQREEVDISILKLFANQAEMLYRALRKQNGLDVEPAIKLIEEATRQVNGEVS